MADEKKPKIKTKKIIEWSITGFFIALLALVAGFRIYQVASGNYDIFGSQFPVVLTDSMEPDYMVGDVIVVKSIDPANVAIGDDVSFYYDITNDGKKDMVTHRLQNIYYYEDATKNPTDSTAHYTFIAHGINKTSSQCSGDCTYQTQLFHEADLIGKVEGTSPFLTVVNKIFSSVWTLIILILIPSLYIVITSVLDLFKTIEEKDEDSPNQELPKNTPNSGGDPLSGLSDKDKERLKKQMLDELLNKGDKKE